MSNVLKLPEFPNRRRDFPGTERLLDLFAGHRHDTGDARWLKENAELLRMLVATRQTLPVQVLDRVHGATASGLADRMAFFPQYYRFFLSIALDLSALGMQALDAPALVARAVEDGLPEAELSDLQRAEARLFAQRAGVAMTADPGLTDRLLGFGGRSATFALPNKKAAYELTHIVFYLSDYGSHGFAGADGLRESLEYAGLVAWLEQNTDLLAEVCMALRFCGATPPAVWEDAVAADLAAFRIAPQQGAAGTDDYHAWLMAAWSVAVAGGAPLARTLPGGALGFAAPRRASALHEVSSVLLRMDGARSPAWPVMRRRLAAALSVPALDLLDRAAATTPAFEPFFARFVRAPSKGQAA
jgi:hypothetical protein